MLVGDRCANRGGRGPLRQDVGEFRCARRLVGVRCASFLVGDRCANRGGRGSLDPRRKVWFKAHCARRMVGVRCANMLVGDCCANRGGRGS